MINLHKIPSLSEICAKPDDNAMQCVNKHKLNAQLRSYATNIRGDQRQQTCEVNKAHLFPPTISEYSQSTIPRLSVNSLVLLFFQQLSYCLTFLDGVFQRRAGSHCVRCYWHRRRGGTAPSPNFWAVETYLLNLSLIHI